MFFIVRRHIARPKAVFDVGHNPGAASAPLAPKRAIPEVDRLHGALAVIVVGGFCVSVVPATLIVVMLAAGHHVDGLRVVAGRDTRGLVVPVPHTAFEVSPIDRMASDRHFPAAGRHLFVRRFNGAAAGITMRRLNEPEYFMKNPFYHRSHMSFGRSFHGHNQGPIVSQPPVSGLDDISSRR